MEVRRMQILHLAGDVFGACRRRRPDPLEINESGLQAWGFFLAFLHFNHEVSTIKNTPPSTHLAARMLHSHGLAIREQRVTNKVGGNGFRAKIQKENSFFSQTFRCGSLRNTSCNNFVGVRQSASAWGLAGPGLAPEIWLTHPIGKGDPANLGQSQKPSEDQLNIELLRTLGVPMRAIHVLSEPIVNTADELNAIDSNLRERGDTAVIIVTNKAHTRRVSTLWEKYHSGVGEALVHAVSLDRFAPSNWWTIESSRAQVIHELLGMINVWAGMPVHRPLQANAPSGGRYRDSARQAGQEAENRRFAEQPSGD